MTSCGGRGRSNPAVARVAVNQVPLQTSAEFVEELQSEARSFQLPVEFAEERAVFVQLTKEHFEIWTTPADIALIRSAGFDHVRLSVNPQPIMDASRRGESERYFDSLDAAMKMILDAGLAVELDMHPDWELTYQEVKQGRVVIAFHAGDESEARRGGELLAKARPLRVEHFDRSGKRM